MTVLAIVQRVLSASVKEVTAGLVANIGPGALVLAAIAPTDSADTLKKVSDQILNLKLWDSPEKRWDASIPDMGYQVILVSQFTLYASVKKSGKIEWRGAAGPDVARQMWDDFVAVFRKEYEKRTGKSGIENVQTGVFGGMMEVALVNDGPTTVEFSIEEDLEELKRKEAKMEKWRKKQQEAAAKKAAKEKERNGNATPVEGEKVAEIEKKLEEISVENK